MTIVQLVRPSAIGMRRHVTQLCRGLRGLGHAVMVAGAVDVAWAEELHEAGIACAPMPVRSRPGPGDLQTARLLRAAASTADLVHAHGLRAGAIALVSGLPFAYTLHAYPGGRLARQVERRVLHRARLVLAVSPSLAAYARAAGALPQRVRVVPGGIVPSPASRPLPSAFSSKATPRIGYLGRLSAEKGVDLLLEALPTVLRTYPQAELAVAGDGPEAARLRSLASRLGIDRRVHFLGRLADPASFLGALEIYVQPSRREGHGIEAAEAISAGCRVVAARTGALRDQLDGLVQFHAPGDVSALAMAILRAITEPQPSGAVAAALERFGVDHQVLATVEAYQETLETL